MTAADVRAVTDDMRRLKDELMQRVRSGDINVHVEPIGIAFTKSELWDLTLGLTQLIGIADEYVALVESGPSRDELLDASTAAAQAFVYAEEASERLGHIMGRLWLKPEPVDLATEPESGRAG